MNIFTHHNTSVNILEAHITTAIINAESQNSETEVYHPPHFVFTPKVLDSRDHLPPEYQKSV